MSQMDPGKLTPRPPPRPLVVPAISTEHTVTPRHLAAVIDIVLSIVGGFVAAKSISDRHPIMQGLALVGVYLGYYLLFEGVFCRTPGKFLTGLIVVGVDGRRCTLRQTVVRTAFRLLEVNPLLLGALPAALSIVCSKFHQRFGDKLARTVVVPSRRAAAFRVSGSNT